MVTFVMLLNITVYGFAVYKAIRQHLSKYTVEYKWDEYGVWLRTMDFFYNEKEAQAFIDKRRKKGLRGAEYRIIKVENINTYLDRLPEVA